MFLNDGKVVFSLFKILIKFLRVNFCYCVNVSSRLFCCVVFGWVGFPFSDVGGSFWMLFFCLLIFDVPVTVLFLLFDHLFFGVFQLFQVLKTNPSSLSF